MHDDTGIPVKPGLDGWAQTNEIGKWVRSYALWVRPTDRRLRAHLRAYVTDCGGFAEGNLELSLPGFSSRPQFREAPTVAACQALMDAAAEESVEAMFGLSCQWLHAGKDDDPDGDHGCEDLKAPRLVPIRFPEPMPVATPDHDRSA